MTIVKWRLIRGFCLLWLWLASIIPSGPGGLWLAGCGSDRSAGTRWVPQGARGGVSQVLHSIHIHGWNTCLPLPCWGAGAASPSLCVSCLSHHHTHGTAVASWAFGRMLYNWLSVWIIHTYALLKLEKFRVFLRMFSLASWSDWLDMSLCIFSQHKLVLNSFFNTPVNSHKFS